MRTPFDPCLLRVQVHLQLLSRHNTNYDDKPCNNDVEEMKSLTLAKRGMHFIT